MLHLHVLVSFSSPGLPRKAVDQIRALFTSIESNRDGTCLPSAVSLVCRISFSSAETAKMEETILSSSNKNSEILFSKG